MCNKPCTVENVIVAVPILCTLKDLGEILDCEEETETKIWGTESVDFWRVQSQTYTLVTFPWVR
jgi:hypothetical protein